MFLESVTRVTHNVMRTLSVLPLFVNRNYKTVFWQKLFMSASKLQQIKKFKLKRIIMNWFLDYLIIKKFPIFLLTDKLLSSWTFEKKKFVFISKRKNYRFDHSKTVLEISLRLIVRDDQNFTGQPIFGNITMEVAQEKKVGI